MSKHLAHDRTITVPRAAIVAGLNELTLKNNIPLTATIELTRRCPCRCRHCYLPETRLRKRSGTGAELATGQWKRILGQLAQNGCMFLVFTGGEPLLRPDFAALCVYASSLGFDIRVFTTGLGLTGKILTKIKKTNISAFEISFYGRKAVHDAVTGCPGSFESTLSAAKKIKEYGFVVKLKTPLMRSNFSQIGYIKSVCEKNDFRYSFDPVIAPANDGSKESLKNRLSARQLTAVFRDPELNGQMLAELGAGGVYADFFCGAGKNALSIGPDGRLYPCLQLPVPLGSLVEKSFSLLWSGSPWLKKWRRAKLSELKKCAACAHAPVCSRCPGISLLEEGDIMGPNKTACKLAKISRLYCS